MSDYAPGGFVAGPPISVKLGPEECVFNRDLECVRSDDGHSHPDYRDQWRP